MIFSVLGLGYIGLPTSAVLASKKFKVKGVDVNPKVIKTVNKGKIHILEPGLEELVSKGVSEGFLSASYKVEKADVFIIAVPTPFEKNHKPNLEFIESAIRSIAPVLEANNLIVLESTSPVGTTEKIIEWLSQDRPDLSLPEYGSPNSNSNIMIAYCPERVLPGDVINELQENDRIIGGVTTKCSEFASSVYSKIFGVKCFITDSRTAELAKLVENSYRDVNIAFANELSLICDNLDINVWELIKLSNHHPRVNILQPGPGVGGHCIAVDPWFIISSSPNEAKLIHTARKVNDHKPEFVLKKIYQLTSKLNKNISELNISCLGLTFKPDIDDLRESPAVLITEKISLMGFKNTFIVEPNIDIIPTSLNKSNVSLKTLDVGINQADIIILLVDHTVFKSMDLSLLSGKQVLDTRGIWS
jgi:UDP-N-acetyl-D-mannosaminuronic acid dehydrogenase